MLFSRRFLPLLTSLNLVLLPGFACHSGHSCQAAESLPAALAANSIGEESYSAEYTRLTKDILLAGIEIERYSLKFRLESARQPKLRRLRYALAQEAGSACGLAFEIVSDDQLGKGRRRPLEVSKPALRNALKTAMVGSIVAASGSGLELSANLLQAAKNKRNGYDFSSANKFVAGKLKQIDSLLAARDALIAAHPEHPARERALIESRVLRGLRDCFINEYSHFHADTRSYTAYQNLFFLLNASYNTVGAVGAYQGYRAVSKPELNGPANILFIVSGAMAATAPLLAGAAKKIVYHSARRSVERELGEKPHFDAKSFSQDCRLLEAASAGGDGTLIASLPSTKRLALYTESGELFRKQLESETTVMRRLEKVAIQNGILGPVIGGQLMTQGILGTVGYYKYTVRPKKQLAHFYYGSVVGTVGTSMATVGTAAWLLSSYAYERRLSKEKRLPVQLIKSRLEHLDELEKLVQGI
ncbi:MAG: hypothetical protein IPK73_21820 [Candidatus Obscuribacter sp.]|nr:hypothetical protein [Candidatus Obscuribacter sp.]MBK9276752.1 hypothetical protein [Candidatus Obscuribacter sp.]